MSYAIIGFGNIGQALAKAFARSGVEASVATTRDPQSFASAAAAIGPEIIPKKLAEAVKADIVFLAVRFESHQDVAKALAQQRRLVRLRKISVSRRSNLAGFRKVGC
jgi:8-hydroxy-5-deazaflavin:NADPH oxidoreductase